MSKINVSKIENTSGDILTLPESVTDGFVRLDSSGILTTTADAPAEMYSNTFFDTTVDGVQSSGIVTAEWTIPDFVKQASGPVKIVIVGYGTQGSTGLCARQNNTLKAFAYSRRHYSPTYGVQTNTSTGTTRPYFNSNTAQGSTTGYNIPWYHRWLIEAKYIPSAVTGSAAEFVAQTCHSTRNSNATSYQTVGYVFQKLSNLTSGDLDTLEIYSSASWFEGFATVFVFKED